MKKLILAAVLATVAGAPAFAQSYNPGYGSGNIAPNVTSANPDGVFRYQPANQPALHARVAYRQNGRAAFAQDITGSVAPREFYKGTDPDPSIRAELRREEQEGW